MKINKQSQFKAQSISQTENNVENLQKNKSRRRFKMYNLQLIAKKQLLIISAIEKTWIRFKADQNPRSKFC